jgi:hypothetical protein
MQQTCFIHCLGIKMSKARSYDVAFREHASRIAKEWYHKNKERLKQERAMKKEGDDEKIISTARSLLKVCGFRNPEQVKAARILFKLGFKDNREVQDTVERALR